MKGLVIGFITPLYLQETIKYRVLIGAVIVKDIWMMLSLKHDLYGSYDEGRV